MSVHYDCPSSFDTHVAVLVIGAGACGLTAALAAAETGVEVMVLERDRTPHGSTGMAQGLICAAGTRAQRERGIDDSFEHFYEDILGKTRGLTDPRLARTIAEQAGPTVDWLADHGLALEVDITWRSAFGHRQPRLHGLPGMSGLDLLQYLQRFAERAGAMVVTSARVIALYADRDARIRGVLVERPDGQREPIGCDALILATCGFGANADMVRTHIPEIAHGPYHGHEGNDGDGIRWGMALGGAVADMAAYQGYGALAIPHRILLNYNLVIGGGVQVNELGERFSNELEDVSGQALKVLAQPQQTAWTLYDERIHQIGMLLPEYRDLILLGGAKKADSWTALAAATGLPEGALVHTMAGVEAMRTGIRNDVFGRDFSRDAALQPPFYAVHVTGALFHTQGGLVVDEQARVCDPDGRPLPNLFAGGGAARGISGPGVWGYLPAAGLCTAVTLGRLAGQHAAELLTDQARQG